jgi:uncharacterized DUF497 family protein
VRSLTIQTEVRGKDVASVTLQFEWDERKAAINYRKHGISFNEARTVFNDPLSITIADPEHPSNEERYLILAYRLKDVFLLLFTQSVLQKFG